MQAEDDDVMFEKTGVEVANFNYYLGERLYLLSINAQIKKTMASYLCKYAYNWLMAYSKFKLGIFCFMPWNGIKFLYISYKTKSI